MVATSFPSAGLKALRAVSALLCGAQAFVREAEGDNSAVNDLPRALIFFDNMH